jgi:hypothetical protein
VIFEKSGLRGTVGGWAPPSAVTVDHASVLKLDSVTTSGQRAISVFDAVSSGEAGVTAAYQEYCSTPQTPGCTIPPLRFIELRVFVVSLAR